MRFQLKPFQDDAAVDVIGGIRDGLLRFKRSGRLTAVSLSAPTGAGKTVIATAVIERLLYGDEATAPSSQMSVLWVTDDPNLNQQTSRKMLLASSHIKAGQIVTVDASFDQKTLDPGTIYFVHIQQLGKGSTNYLTIGDKRRWSLWDTIGNTIQEKGGEFLLVIDEAHRGTKARVDGNKTITAQLMDGAGGTLPPTPVVLGITATPQRFISAMTLAGQRTIEPVGVSPEAVRESGLLKEKIRIKHPIDGELGDSTLLEMAVRDLRTYDKLWSTYSTTQAEPPVKPALVVQVKPGATDNELKSILETLAGAWDELDGKAIGHCLQEHKTLQLGVRSLRYVAPQDIQDDQLLRVILFKEALTTGWDCPRAEVMLSFRSAVDYTYIAQLIGRMVRTPLAHSIATDEVLNTVALYLPYYDEKQVEQIVSGLQSDESQIASKLEVDAVICSRNGDTPAPVWEMLGKMPTYTRPARNHRNEVARLNALAVLLAGNRIKLDAVETARRHLTNTLAREAIRLGQKLRDRENDFEKLDYMTQTFDVATGKIDKEKAQVDLNARNVDDLLRRAKRVLGDSAASWYWDTLCEEGKEPDEAKLHVAALADDPTVVPAVETAASNLIDSWRTTYNSAINNLPDAKRAAFYAIWQQAKAPQQVTMIMPSQITAAGKGLLQPRHIFADEQHMFPATFTGWETDVLKAELGKADTLVAWYRNPSGGTASLAIPYEQSGTARTLYPDFLFFHQAGSEIVADIVDPHRPNESDTGPKWLGLATYAISHGCLFRRVLAVIKNQNDMLMSLDLKNPNVAARLATASNETDIRNIFTELGGLY